MTGKERETLSHSHSLELRGGRTLLGAGEEVDEEAGWGNGGTKERPRRFKMAAGGALCQHKDKNGGQITQFSLGTISNCNSCSVALAKCFPPPQNYSSLK